jgi:hypothetical protein
MSGGGWFDGEQRMNGIAFDRLQGEVTGQNVGGASADQDGGQVSSVEGRELARLFDSRSRGGPEPRGIRPVDTGQERADTDAEAPGQGGMTGLRLESGFLAQEVGEGESRASGFWQITSGGSGAKTKKGADAVAGRSVKHHAGTGPQKAGDFTEGASELV